MNSLLARLVAIALLRGGPQDLPFDARLLTRLLVAWALLQLFAQYVLFEGRGGLLQLPVALAFLLLPIHGLLRLRGRPERFLQTATAFVGCSLLFGLAVLLVMLGADPAPAAGEPAPQPSTLQALLGLVWLLLTAWKLAVDAHIWRQALEFPPPLAIATSLTLFLAEIAVLSRLAGATE
ncbi:hypothetical protein [Aquimonas voraii]|uniref:Uncharacterized protein n=1 Tax=Aquimonas voraii TaxID=265719 RepID=A0A1G6ZC33_9GAMM|nr:hypothetical protein [Aquimonas voraii]SDE00032.1 hypothetical protein SAMN04488509_11340 [Aquimonas voraii]